MDDKTGFICLRAIIEQVQKIERFGAHLAMVEACETIAGVMAEQAELFAMAEKSKEPELKNWAQKKAQEGRIYSGHYLAIRDALRLCNLVAELVEQVKTFRECGGVDFLDLLSKNETKDEQCATKHDGAAF